MSPLLYNVYVDDLSINLNGVSAGFYINSTLINHLMCADDIVLQAASVTGLQKLVSICCDYVNDFNIKYNELKSTCMVISDRRKYDVLPSIKMGNKLLIYVNNVKYLGHS